jgi:hypothetical protein
MAYLVEANTISLHDSVVTWRKGLKVLKYVIYPRDMSTPNISMTCLAITVGSSTSFRPSSLLHVATKPSPAASKLTQGYWDFRIPRVRLPDCLILARMISRHLVGRLSSIWGCVLWKRTRPGRIRVSHCPPSPLRH